MSNQYYFWLKLVCLLSLIGILLCTGKQRDDGQDDRFLAADIISDETSRSTSYVLSTSVDDIADDGYVDIPALLNNASFVCSGNISEIEYQALFDLYQATNGPYWDYPDSSDAVEWVFPSLLSAPCSQQWSGLLCSAVNATNPNNTTTHNTSYNCSVVGILLDAHSLLGTMPESIQLFSELQFLDLRENSLDQTIPTAIGSLSNLIYFGIESNSFVSHIPTEVGLLKELLYFEVGKNSLSGQLPVSLFTLPKLIGLFIEINLFSGPFPSELGNLTALEQLNIETNLFTGEIPFEFYNLTHLQHFIAERNRLSGCLNPSLLPRLHLLREIAIDQNLLSCSLPTEIGQLEHILRLNFADNYLTNTLPNELFVLPILEQVTVTSNYLSGSISSMIGSLSNLHQFEIPYNMFTNTIPTEIAKLFKLQTFLIGTNILEGTIPSEIYDLTNLEEIYLDYNQFYGIIPTSNSIHSLNDLQYLRYFVVANNYLTGTIPSEVYQLTQLRELAVGENMFTGTISTMINHCKLLTFIDFEYNLLTNSYPTTDFHSMLSLRGIGSSFNYLTGTLSFLDTNNSKSVPILLQSFEMSHNFISGTLPQLLQLFVYLENFEMSTNLLSGNIEFLFSDAVIATTAYLENLVFLELNSNMLTGSLPTNLFIFSKFPSLTTVVLYENCFTGSLPTTLCSASSLNILILDAVSSAAQCDWHLSSWLRSFIHVIISKRQLRGGIPTCLWSLPNLETVHLSGNGLTGTLPDTLLPLPLSPTSSLSFSHSLCDQSSLTTICNSQQIYNRYSFNHHKKHYKNLNPNGLPTATSLLSDVSLASNTLSGTIPLSWQQRSWQALDLSGNKLTGILSQSFIDNTSTCYTDIVASPEISVNNHQIRKLRNDNYMSHKNLNILSNNDDRVTATDDLDDQIITTCGNIDLTVNRLSGDIPSSFRYAKSINILNGNLFNCDQQSKPIYDPNEKEYVCGSIDFNNAFITSICAIGIVALIGCVVIFATKSIAFYRYSSNNSNNDDSQDNNSSMYGSICSLWDWDVLDVIMDITALSTTSITTTTIDKGCTANNSNNSSSNRNDTELLTIIHNFRSILFRSFAHLLLYVYTKYYICICMIIYILLKVVSTHSNEDERYSFSTHTYQYLWISSIAFLRGPIVGSLLFCFVCISLFQLGRTERNVWIAIQSNKNSNNNSNNYINNNVVQNVKYLLNDCIHCVHSNCRYYCYCCYNYRFSIPTISTVTLLLLLLCVAHALCMISINVLYVYIVLKGLSSAYYLFLVQVSLSVFKLIWNRFCVRWIVSYVPIALQGSNSKSNSSSNKSTITPAKAIQLSTLIAMITFIASPVIASFFTDNNCFRYIITGQPAVDSSFKVDSFECILECNVICISHCEMTDLYQPVIDTTVVPSWQYSYQCASSLIVNYSPVLLYSYTLSGLVLPLLQQLLLVLIVSKYWKSLQQKQQLLLQQLRDKHWNSISSFGNYCGLSFKFIFVSSLKGNIFTRFLIDFPTETIDNNKATASSTVVENPISKEPNSSEVDDIAIATTTAYSSTAKAYLYVARLEAVKAMSKLYLNLGVITTFGLASPLIAIVVAIDTIYLLVSTNTALHQLLFTSHLFPSSLSIFSSSINQTNNSTNISGVDGNDFLAIKRIALRYCCDVFDNRSCPSICLWIIFAMNCGFWSLFVLDIFGDVFGAAVGGSLILLLPIVGSIVLYVSARFGYTSNFDAEVDCNVDVETQDINGKDTIRDTLSSPDSGSSSESDRACSVVEMRTVSINGLNFSDNLSMNARF